MTVPNFIPSGGIGTTYKDPYSNEEYEFTQTGWVKKSQDIQKETSQKGTFDVKPDEKQLVEKLQATGTDKTKIQNAISERRRVLSNINQTEGEQVEEKIASTKDMTGITDQKVSNPFKGLSKKEVLRDAFNKGVTDTAELERIGTFYEMVTDEATDEELQSKITAVKQGFPIDKLEVEDQIAVYNAMGKGKQTTEVGTEGISDFQTQFLGEEEKEAVKQSNTKIEKANDLLGVLDAIETGELKGKEAENTLNAIAADFNESTFETGGKNLTEMEQALLQGNRPTVEIREQNIIQKMTGKVPKQTGKVLDDYDTLRDKMNTTIMLAQRAKARAAGTPPPPISGEGGEVTEGETTISGLEDKKEGITKPRGVVDALDKAYSLAVEPVVKGVAGYLQLLGTAAGTAALPTIAEVSPQAGEKLADMLEPVIENKYSTPKQTLVTGGLQTAGGVGAAVDLWTLGQGTSVVKQAAKIGGRNMAINMPVFGLGNAIKAERTGGDAKEAFWEGAFGQEYVGPFEGMFGESTEAKLADTVTTIILPIAGEHLLRKTMTGQAFDDINTEQLKKKISDSFDPENLEKYKPKGMPVRDPGKASVDLLKLKASERTSVAQAEDLAQKTISITESNTIRNMAKEMPEIRRSSGNYIKSRVKELDNIRGFSANKVKSLIIDEVSQSTGAQAYPKKFKKFTEDGGILDEMLGGNYETKSGFNVMKPSQLDKSRKAFNKGIKSNWFSKGQPVSSSGEALQDMKWVSSNVIKDIFKNEQGFEDITKAIELQHISLSAEPILSNTALSSKRPLFEAGVARAFINLIKNSFDTVMTPQKIKGIRYRLGTTPQKEIIDMIKKSSE